MQLSPEQIAQFHSDGYLAVPDFWDEREIAAMRAELEHLKQHGLLHNVATDGDGATTSSAKANLQLCPMAPHSALFRAMPFAPKVIEAVSQLLGPEVLLQLDQVFLKPAQHGSGTNWHQDNAYFRLSDPMQSTALWTAIHDANEANGAMRIVPGATHENLEHARDPDSSHHIRCHPDEAKARLLEMPAGGALFFAYGTPHATGANTTDQERAGVALHFISGAQQGIAFGGFDTEKRPILAGPRATGGEREYGERIDGTWHEEVKDVLQNAS